MPPSRFKPNARLEITIGRSSPIVVPVMLLADLAYQQAPDGQILAVAQRDSAGWHYLPDPEAHVRVFGLRGRPPRAGSSTELRRFELRCTADELTSWTLAAGDHPVGAWLRDVANNAAKRAAKRAESGGAS